MVIYINETPIGIIATKVPENLYGFVELQDCERVSLMPHRTIEEVRSTEKPHIKRERLHTDLLLHNH